MLMSRKSLLCTLCLLVAVPALADTPEGVPTDPLAPNLTFRQLGEDRKSLLEEATGVKLAPPQGWSTVTPQENVTKAPTVQAPAAAGGATVSPRADARATGAFDSFTPAGRVIKQLAFDGVVVAAPLPLGRDLVVATDSALTRVDPVDGSTRWSIKLNGRAAPMVASGNRVYVATDTGSLLCLDGATGNELWRHDDENRSYKAGLALLDGRLFAADLNKNLTAYDAASGRELWSKKASRGFTAAPMVFGNLLLVGYNNTTFEALNPQTGAKVFSGGAGGAIYHSPTGDNGVVYYAGDDGVIKAVRTEKVIPLWQSAPLGPLTSSPIPAGDRVYAVSGEGIVWALNAKTGRPELKSDLGGPVATEPVLTGNTLVVADGNGLVHLLPLNSKGKAAVLQLKTPGEASPIAAFGSLWVPAGNMIVEVQ